MAQETTHDRLVKGLKAKGAVQICTERQCTVLRRVGTNWNYYVSSSGNLRTGLSWASSIAVPAAFRRELMRETRVSQKRT